jgi:hypothetical protein
MRQTLFYDSAGQFYGTTAWMQEVEQRWSNCRENRQSLKSGALGNTQHPIQQLGTRKYPAWKSLLGNQVQSWPIATRPHHAAFIHVLCPFFLYVIFKAQFF